MKPRGPQLEPTCLTRKQANAYIEAFHKHHGQVTGHRFIVGAVAAGSLVGIAIAGRPRARLIDQYVNVEVSRLCADGTKNVCSFLYSRVARVARELGFATCFTAILDSESSMNAQAPDIADNPFGQAVRELSRKRARLVDDAVRIWSAQACLPPEEWLQHWQPQVTVEPGDAPGMVKLVVCAVAKPVLSFQERQ